MIIRKCDRCGKTIGALETYADVVNGMYIDMERMMILLYLLIFVHAAMTIFLSSYLLNL